MSVNYCYYQLQLACSQKLIASVCVDRDDPDAFEAGYIERVTPKYVLIEAVTPWGRTDGWVLRRADEVFQVYMGEDYEIRLQMLLESYGDHFESFLPDEAKGTNLILDVMENAMRKHMLVTVQVDTEPWTGFIQEANDLHATMEVLDFFGGTEGIRQFAVRDVEWLSVGTQEEEMFARLREERLKILPQD